MRLISKLSTIMTPSAHERHEQGPSVKRPVGLLTHNALQHSVSLSLLISRTSFFTVQLANVDILFHRTVPSVIMMRSTVILPSLF